MTPEYWYSFTTNEDIHKSSLAVGIIVTLFLLIGLPSNLIIIVSIVGKRLYKDTTHILLLNLAISDLLVCLLVMPMVIVTGFAGGFAFGNSDYVRCQVCQTGTILLIALTLLSMYNVGFLSLDRFIFIVLPLHYRRYVTVPRVAIALCMTWIASTAVSLVPLLGFGEARYVHYITGCTTTFGTAPDVYYIALLLILNLIPVIITVFTNLWIACLVRREINKIYKARKSLSGDQQLKNQKLNMQRQIRKKNNKKQLALIQVFGAIVVANFIVWTPLVILVVLTQTVQAGEIPLGCYITAYFCIIVHSVLHPLIEGCLIPEIKVVFKRILGFSCCFKTGTNSNETTEDDSTMSYSDRWDCCNVCALAVLPS